MNNIPTHSNKRGATTYLAKNDEINKGIDVTVDRLSHDSGPLTRWRLRRVRGREAVRLNETAMVDYMAARRRTLHDRIKGEEDYAKKRTLADGIDRTKTIEKEIARIMAETVVEFEGLIGEREKLALIKEAELIAEIEELVEAGKVSPERAEQYIARIQASTDRVVETVDSTIREMLYNLRQRFEQALQMD